MDPILTTSWVMMKRGVTHHFKLFVPNVLNKSSRQTPIKLCITIYRVNSEDGILEKIARSYPKF